VLPPVEFELLLSPEALSRWRIGRDGVIAAPPATGTPVPLPYLVFLRAQPVLGVNFHELLGRDPDRGLYGGVVYRQIEPLTVGQRVAASSVVQDRRTVASARGELTITTFLTTYRCDGVVHATEAVRMVDLPPMPEADGAAAPAAGAIRERVHPLLARIPAITRNQVAWLTVETGDTNALHLDAPYAAKRGFPDVVVPATLITALLEREIEAASARRVVELDVRYHAPTFPGEAIELCASVAGDAMAFQAFCGTGLRAEGRVRLQEN
jgi:acyl dehydratase